MSLERKLARWKEAGLIDEAARARIEAFEHGQRRPMVLYALAVLGAGTVGLGIVSTIAANWNVIPGAAKLGGDLVLGTTLATATYVAVERRLGWPIEVLVTLLYGFTLASLALVGQVYQLGTPTYRGLLVWSAVTGPLVLLGRSRYLAVLVVAGLAVTHGATLVALFRFLDRLTGLSEGGKRNLVATLVFASPFLYVVLARVPWLVRERPELSQTMTGLAWGVVLLAGFALQLVWYDDLSGDQLLGWSLAATGAIAAALAVALPALYPAMAVPARRALAWILGVGWLTLALGTAVERPEVKVVGALLQVAWLGLFAWNTIALGRVRLFNLLTALVAVRVLVIFFEVFGSLLGTGVGLITGGALTLLIAWAWWSKTRDVAERLERPAPRGDRVA